MFKNYFSTAFRSLARNKRYSAINILGLSVGVAVCMLIFIVIQFQTSFDRFHPRQERIFRVLTARQPNAAAPVEFKKNVPFPLPAALEAAFPQLEKVAPVYASHNDELQVLDDDGNRIKNFKEESGVFYTSPSFFDMFHFPLLAGSYQSLAHPNNVLLTKEIAATYFGNWKNAMGKTITLTGYYNIGAALFQFPATTLKVSGILATVPANTDFRLKLVVAWGTDFTGDKQYGFQQPGWQGTADNFGCYVLLPPHSSVDNFNQQLRVFAQKVAPAGSRDSYLLQPLSAVHYDGEAGNYSNKVVSRQLLNVLWLIAAFILLIACVNFINLSTAQAINRSKEVAVRKVLGSNAFQLQSQFMVETGLLVIMAVLLAVLMSLLALPYVNQLLEIALPVSIFLHPAFLLFLLGTTLFATAVAGFYPALVLSRFSPVNALKSKFAGEGGKGISVRRGLVVFQFVIAQALIIATLVVVQQMDFFINRPLGFDKEAIFTIPYRPDHHQPEAYIKQQLLAINGVQVVSFGSNTPVEDENNVFTAVQFDGAAKEAGFQAIARFADHDYVPTYQLQLVAGRNLQPSGFTQEFLVNETFVKNLGLKKPDDILGREISIMGGLIKCPVVGVLKDFTDRPLHSSLAPLLIAANSTMYRQVAIKLATTNLSSTMASVKKVWERTFPDYVYEYRFLDNKIESFYKQEAQLSQLTNLFAGVAVLLSCLGLYGLASFMAARRIKEVGIRKVLGASASNILYLFSKEFLLLVFIAFAIAAPVAWYCMHQWLQHYAYRITISWWLFAAGGLASLFIALATISFQAIKTAVANPVKSLRTE